MAKRGKIGGLETASNMQRPSRIKKYKYLYMIICEDENTEKVYFQSFEVRIPKATIYLEAVGTGLDPLGIVKRAIHEKERLEDQSGRSVDVVWLVFDKDDADINEARIARFKDAFAFANELNFNVAYSNEVFELWLLLHLIEIDPARLLPRREVYRLLETAIRAKPGYEGFEYKHGNEAVLHAIAEIGDEQAALRRASQLIDYHAGKSPIECNPVTHIGNLIIDLYSWIAYYGYQS